MLENFKVKYEQHCFLLRQTTFLLKQKILGRTFKANMIFQAQMIFCCLPENPNLNQ